MLDLHALKAQDLRALDPAAMARLAEQMLAHMAEQTRQIDARDQQIAQQAQALKFKDARIERITFELARLKAWRFGARTEAMNAEQRQLFEETLAEDQASLEAQLHALQGKGSQASAPPADGQAPRKPRRQALPEHLRRVEHRHEPESTLCPSFGCGQPMTRIGEDVSERLDIVPAEFFVHRHIRGKWVCKCCLRKGEGSLVQESVLPQIIDKGQPTAGLLAHTLVSRFVDHLPYYRQEQINARSGVHTPRSTLAAWSGAASASLMPLYEAHRAFVLGAAVLHADEIPVRMLDPGAGKTVKAYVWAYARGEHDAMPGVIYDFCRGRGSRYPADFLSQWGARSVATITQATTPCSNARVVSRRDAWHMRGASSMNWPRPTPAPWPSKPCSASRGCTASRPRRVERRMLSGWRTGSSMPSRCGTNCTLGYAWSAHACPTAAASLRRWTTASDVGRHWGDSCTMAR